MTQEDTIPDGCEEQAGNRPSDASPINGVSPPAEHRFKPGESGNPRGRPPERPIAAAIRARLDRNDGAAIGDIADVVVAKARHGDFRFVRELLDRVDGRLTDRLEVSENLAIPIITNEMMDTLRRRFDAAGDVKYHPDLPTINEILRAEGGDPAPADETEEAE